MQHVAVKTEENEKGIFEQQISIAFICLRHSLTLGQL